MGDSEFTTSIVDPVRNPPIEISTNMFFPSAEVPSFPISNAEALRLLDWFLYSIDGMLDLFDPERVRAGLQAWMANSQEESNLQSAIFYLVLAIGAQTCPSGFGLMADEYFNYGRHLGLGHGTREVSQGSLQYYSLVSTYLMGQSLMDTAFI